MGSTIKIVSSNSSGNGYIIQSNQEAIFLELGCRTHEYFNKIMEDKPRVGGCIASHRWRHDDHLNISTAKEMLRRGIPVFFGENVYEELLKEGSIRGIKPLPTAQKTLIGGFTIQPFEVAHNVPNYGFLIETPSGERIVFVTDAIECKYRFKDIDCIMVECNHDDDTLLDNLAENEVSPSHPENHLCLSDCIAFCKANMNPHLKQVVLIHLSHTNINEDFALKSVQEALPPVKVSVAHSGDTFEIESDKF